MQQRHGLLHRLRRKGVLGAVDGGDEQRACVFAELGRGRARLRLRLVDERSGHIGLCQRDAHLVIPLEPQRPAEAEHGSFRHIAGPRQRGDRKVLRFVGVVDQIIGHHPPGFGQFVLPLVQQLPEIRRHVFFSYSLPDPVPAARRLHCRDLLFLIGKYKRIFPS